MEQDIRYIASNGFIVDIQTGETIDIIFEELVDIQIDYWNRNQE